MGQSVRILILTPGNNFPLNLLLLKEENDKIGDIRARRGGPPPWVSQVHGAAVQRGSEPEAGVPGTPGDQKGPDTPSSPAVLAFLGR